VKITVILPAYNEANRIEKAVKEVKNWMDRLGYDYEIIIAEDGSTDGTDRIARSLAEKDERVIHLHSDVRLGRGKALANAIKKSRGDVVAYLDVDLSTDMSHLKELIDSIVVQGYDISIGSRLMKESDVERSFKRDFLSRVYNFLVRSMLGSKIRDHQCGFKAFKRESILKIIDQVKDNHWFWDTEVLVLAQRMGYRIREIPVRWRQSEETKVRFLKDSLYMFSQILRMWMESRRSRKFFAISLIISVSILIALAYFSGFNIEVLSRISPKSVLLASIVYIVSFFVRGYRFGYILLKLGFKCPVIFSTEGIAIGQMINVVTPAKLGDLVRTYVFKLKEVPISSCISGLAVERLFDLFTVILFSFLSITVLGSFKYVRMPIYATLALLSIVSLVFVFSRMENLIGKMSKDVNIALRSGYFVLSLISITNWLIDVLTCYLIAIAFNVSFWIIMLAVAISNIVKAIPVTPGGIGAYEITMTGILAAFGLNMGEAFTVSLVDHTLKNVLTVLMGYISIAHLNIKIREIA